MELAIRSGDTCDFDSDYSVEERNRAFGPMPDNCGKCILDRQSKKILVVVPPRIPGVTCQVDVAAFSSLEKCFREVILSAVDMQAKSISIPALGVKYHHWTPLQSAVAARRAIEFHKDDIPDDFKVVLAVGDKEEDLKMWDDILIFTV